MLEKHDMDIKTTFLITFSIYRGRIFSYRLIKKRFISELLQYYGVICHSLTKNLRHMDCGNDALEG